MTIARVLFSPLVSLLFVGFTSAAPPNDGKDELEGRWKLKALVLEGKPFPQQIKGTSFLFVKDTLTIVPPDEVAEEFPKQTLRFMLHPQTEPKSIDTTNLDGTDKGRTSAGIYRIEGDSLTICISTASGLPRPDRFESAKASMSAVYTLQRAKSEH